MNLDNVAHSPAQTGVNAVFSGSEQPIAPISDIAVHTAGGEGKRSVSDAAGSVTDWRRKQTAEDARQRTEDDEQKTGDPSAAVRSPSSDPATELAIEADATPPQPEPSGER